MRYSLNSLLKFLVIAFFLPLVVSGQQGSSANKNAVQAYAQAGVELGKKNYPGAITALKAALTTDPAFTAAYQQLGDVYRLTSDYDNAILNYNKVLELNPEFYRGTYLGLAQSELNTGKYEPALSHFKKYLSYPGIPEENKKRIVKYIDDCVFSITAVKHPVAFSPLNLGQNINTADLEYLPVVTADEETLIFTRQSQQKEDFYKSIKVNGQWQKAVYLSPAINTAEYNEGAQCISPDGNYLFFTGCNRPGGLGSCDIYLSRKEGNDWSKPFNLGGPVNTRGWESQPSISADGKTLYFTSNRPGGYGGYDIWKAELQPGGSWSAPVNAGPTVNTAYDELSPYLHPDNQTLYFSSDGWPGLGNKDLFMSRKDASGNWQQPQNLGYPINTCNEEAGITISSDGKTAFFNAVKPDGYGGQDLYSFELPQGLRPAPVTYVKGTVVDKATKEPLNAGLKIIDVSSGTIVYDDFSDTETGEFLATMPAGKTYALTISKPGYVFYSANFTLKDAGAASTPFLLHVPLEKITIGALTVLRNVFFDSNKYDLLPESREELQQLIEFLNSNPAVHIEVSGHTDNLGDDKTNQLLSENRAKAVVSYLTANKISSSRLTYKGYGELKPVADNSTENGRKLNRRTEFRVVGK